MKVLVTSIPFAAKSGRALEILDDAGVDLVVNPLGRKPDERELVEMVRGFDAVLAGTERWSDEVMESAPDLRLIARMGTGLDGVDLMAARRRGIAVTWTPGAPVEAVAEMTVALALSALRGVHESNLAMHAGRWHRVSGRRLGDVTVGVVGLGPIGRRVLDLIGAFRPPRVLLHDLRPDESVLIGSGSPTPEWTGLEELLTESDLVTVHVPLSSSTRGLINEVGLRRMPSDAVLVNTSRGGVVDEAALHRVLVEGHLGAVALDVFESEPYSGPLTGFERCILTSHMSSSSVDCRGRMEAEAADEVVRLSTGRGPIHPVPEAEYLMQAGDQ